MMIKIKSFILFLCICSPFAVIAQYSRDISNLNWKIWLDKKAGWWNDSLFLPPYNLQIIPAYLPGAILSKEKPAIVAKKILQNMVSYAATASKN